MQKISTTTELRTELRKLLAYAQTERPSRIKLSQDLAFLSDRLAGRKEKKTDWMRKFEDAFLELKPSARGRIDWHSAEYLYNEGVTPEDAATRMTMRKASSRPPFEEMIILLSQAREIAYTLYTEARNEGAQRTARAFNTALGKLSESQRLFAEIGRDRKLMGL